MSKHDAIMTKGLATIATFAMAAAFAIPAFATEPAVPATSTSTTAASTTGGNLNVQSYHNYNGDESQTRDGANLPAAFDLRNVDGKDYTTPVKSQGGWGVCWAFGTLSSLESTLLKDGKATTAPDLSELQLAWYASRPLSQDTYDKTTLLKSPMNLPDQIGEGSSVVVDAGKTESLVSQVMNKGANYPDATATLASWQGASNESDIPYSAVPDPYSPNYKDDEPGLDESLRTKAAVHMQNVDFLPSPATFTTTIGGQKSDYTKDYKFDPAAVQTIKEALMSDGVVAMGYHISSSSEGYYNDEHNAQYVDKYITHGDNATTMNHGVSIVGWDDNYDRNNFKSSKNELPPANGAWIIKNSWGDQWGTNAGNDKATKGYHYLSYYDMTISQPSVFFADDAPAGRQFSYDNNYQYDFLGDASVAQIKPNAFGDKGSLANVFTAKGYENLDAVSVTTSNPGSQVTYKVYALNDGAKVPTDGALLASKTETVEFGGYHTLKLDKAVRLYPGEKFSVVETITGRDGRYVPLEIAARDDNDPDENGAGHQKHQEAKVSAGQSYISKDDGSTWTDAATLGPKDINVSAQVIPSAFGGNYQLFSTGNVEIKAFTTNSTEDASTAKVTLPAPSSRYTVTASSTTPKLGDTVTLTFAAVNGYAKTDKFSLLVNGKPVALAADGTVSVKVYGDLDVTLADGSVARPLADKAPTFKDVTSKTPHEADIAWLAQAGVGKGYEDGTFGGMRTVVRQDMAAFLYRLAGSPAFDADAALKAKPFTDVTKDTPHYKEILWLASTGIAKGYRNADDTYSFGGMRTVVRQDMAAFLHRYADWTKAAPDLGGAQNFSDVSANTPHAEDITWLSQTGVTQGFLDDSFGGMRDVVRQDMAAFLHRMDTNVLK